MMECFNPNSSGYISNSWQIVEDLGLNEIRVLCGQYGDTWQINPSVYPNTWAQNLENFLTLADSHHVKVVFWAMGTIWGTDFGILGPSWGDSMTPIPTAKAIVDQLTGNNYLGHNFITDPRIAYWDVDNEPDLTDPTDLDWVIQMCDYIRSKGGKTTVASPRMNNDWIRGLDFSTFVPLLGDHVDFLEFHYYGIWELGAYHTVNGVPNWDSWEAYYKTQVQQIISGRGSFGMDEIILGEFGLWRGAGSDAGTSTTYTDADRAEYYTRTLRVFNQLGIKNWCFHDLFKEPGKTNSAYYSIVDVNGQYFPFVSDIIKANT
jgi:hypothetical protein